jgi:hypothetical protein
LGRLVASALRRPLRTRSPAASSEIMLCASRRWRRCWRFRSPRPDLRRIPAASPPPRPGTPPG